MLYQLSWNLCRKLALYGLYAILPLRIIMFISTYIYVFLINNFVHINS